MHESLAATARAKRRREDGAVLLGIEEVLGEAGLDVARLLLARLLARLRHLAPPLLLLPPLPAPTAVLVLGFLLRREIEPTSQRINWKTTDGDSVAEPLVGPAQSEWEWAWALPGPSRAPLCGQPRPSRDSGIGNVVAMARRLARGRGFPAPLVQPRIRGERKRELRLRWWSCCGYHHPYRFLEVGR